MPREKRFCDDLSLAFRQSIQRSRRANFVSRWERDNGNLLTNVVDFYIHFPAARSTRNRGVR
jgi:hypothetical protein